LIFGPDAEILVGLFRHWLRTKKSRKWD